MRLIAQSVLIAIIIVGIGSYALRAANGSLGSMIVILTIGAVLLDPVIAKAPARFARSLVIGAILAASSFASVLVFAPIIVQAIALLMLGAFIGLSLSVLIENGTIPPSDAQWLAVLAAIVAGIISVAIVGFARIGGSIARALGPEVRFEPTNPWVSLVGPALFYLAIVLPSYAHLGRRSFIRSSAVFGAIVSLGSIGVYLVI